MKEEVSVPLKSEGAREKGRGRTVRVEGGGEVVAVACIRGGERESTGQLVLQVKGVNERVSE